MSHSKDQEQIVTRILSYKPHQFYEILSVSKTSSDGEIKKSYRKLAIKLHPDKNPHPRAAEAFKHVNKAWEVLSDPSKRRIFDQTGSDPDLRGAAGFSSSSAYGGSPFGGASGFSGFSQQGFGNEFQDDIFNMFFGGGMPQGRGGPQTFSFGNNGFTFSTFGGGQDFFSNARAQQRRQQRRRHEEQQRRQPTGWDTILQILPLAVIIIAMLFSTILQDDTPDYSFKKTSRFNVQRATPKHNIPFYVKPGFTDNLNDRKLKNFDNKVEALYVRDTQNNCAREQIKRNDMMEDAQGWFFTDQRRLERAQNMPMPSCQRLKDLGLL